jgi:hypothetical protein
MSRLAGICGTPITHYLKPPQCHGDRAIEHGVLKITIHNHQIMDSENQPRPGPRPGWSFIHVLPHRPNASKNRLGALLALSEATEMAKPTVAHSESQAF